MDRATLFPKPSLDTQAIMQHADKAMYYAKKSGKGQVCYFDGIKSTLI